MNVQSAELVQAEKDLSSLKSLKNEDAPSNVFCPNCEKRGLTKTEMQTSMFQYIICLVTFTFIPAAQIGCCLIPFCVGSCKDTLHKCGSCDAVLGAKRKI